MQARAKAVVMALATSTEAPVVQARVAMAVVMNHARVAGLAVGADVDVAIKEGGHE